jgi:Smg protein
MTDRWYQMLAALRAHFAPDADVGDVEQYLAARGLARHEIDEVLARFVSQNASGAAPRVVQLSRPALRVQGPHERGRFTPDAWGYLLTLYNTASTGLGIFETIVERALHHLDGPITRQDIRLLAEELGVEVDALPVDHSQLH